MPLGFLNPAIYALGMRANYTNCFHDIIAGNNYSTGSPTNFPAVAGYDLCTGLGTPTGSALINALTEPLQITPATPFIFTGPVGGPFGPAAQNYSLNNTGTNALSWALADSASWLSASPMSGTIPMGGPAATVTVSLTSAATSFSAGSYSTSMAFTNSDDNVGQTRQVILAVVTMPIITMQPTNRAVLEGMPAAFAVGTGSNALMFYQWQYDGSNLTDNGNMSGSVTTNLTIANVSPANVGTYSVIVSNAAGTAFSSNALLTIMPSLPIFTEQPTNQTSLPGQTVTFTVATVGTHPFSYRWRDNGTNLSDNAIISGSSNVTLTLNNVSPANAGIYSVVVSNALGAVTSSNAVLEVDSVTATGVTLNCAYSFGVSDGEYPYCPLVQGADGSLYGTTVEGGTNGGYGTVFRMATNGALTTLYSFGSADGASPYAGLLLGKDGNFYGTTAGGGTNDDGTIFQITTNGVLTTLMSFNDTNGSFSVAGLMQASDGNLYGTTLDGGIHEMGTVFRVTTNGALTTMFSFDSLHGSHSSAVLTQGVDGNFYGTTETGGSDNFGTVFRLTTNGTLTTLVSFDYTNNGAYPIPGLVQDTDGSFYGTTYYGGANYEGTIFKMTPDGTLTTLNSFAGSDGAYPYGGLMLGSDGNLYGTTEEGGSYWYGTVFRLTPDGTLLKLLDFDGYQGLSPEAALIQTADGDLYGTTAWGGVGYSGSNPGYGAIFQINIDCPLQFTRQPASQSVFVGADAILSAAVSGSAPLYYQWRGNGTNLTDGGNIYGSANRTLTFSNVIPGNAGTYSLIVSNTQGFVVSSNATLAVTSSAPIIVLQPANQTSLPDGIVEFAVQALGNVPMSYQWWFNSTNMTGATNATLIMTGITTNQAGNYSVVVSNTAGFATSSNATLSVITNAPTSLMTFDDLKGTGLPVPDGYNGLNWNNFYYLDGVNFSGNPSGYGAGVVSQSNVAYNAYGNPATISSAASFSLLSAYLTAAWSSNLHVEVIGYAGDTLKYDNTYTVSTNAPTFINFNYSTITMVEFISANNSQIVIDNMTIMTAPAVPQIITQPVDLMVRAGATAVFSVAALGTEPFSYFWQRNGTSIPGTTGASVAIHNVQPSDSGSAFSCIVSNAYGAATSQVAVLTLATNRDYFTELFDPGSNHVNDLSYKMLTFTPDGSTSFYKANCDPTDAFQSSSNGVALTLSDDNYVQINLLSGAQVSLYGTNYSTLFIGSNGYITFGSGDWRYDESLMNHFNRPRISALFVDLDPSFGGAVTWTQLVDRVVVTFQDVFDWDSGGQNSFQYELFYNGVIRLSYLGISAEEGLAGLSQGAGVPADFADSDLTSYGPSDALVVQPAGGLNVQGCQGGPFAPTNIVYTLYNNEGSAVGWTASDIQSWVTLSASGGTLAAGASTNVMVSINTNAWNLGVGTSQATVTFSNNVSGAFQAREVVLTIVDYNWWPTGFEAWTNRMMLTFSGYGRPETLTNFPALAILNANLPGFSYGQFASTNGYDLRFSTADGSDNLKYEIEQWNTNGTSLVWIQVPQLYSGYYIWAYWGNTNAGVASAPPAYATNGAAWDAKAFAAVWHMGQSNALDSTANKNKGTAIAAVSNAVGMIGGAQKMSGNAHVTIPNSGSLDFTAPNATYSAWVCFSTVPNGEQVLIRNEQYRELGFSDATHLRDMLNTTGMSGWTAGNDDLISPAPVVGHWYYVAFTYNGSVIRNFWNGVPLNAGHTVTGNINFDTYTTGIGAYNGNGDAGPISLAINAIIDEVRIEQVFRSTNWIWATYMTVASNASFSAYGVAQTAVATNEIPPAAWIQEYFPGTATSNYAGLAASDADGNGMTVWQDYLAGINPTNHSSSFSVIIATSGGQIIVSVPSILTDSNYNGLTRYYDIEQCTNLLISGSWQLVPNYSGLPANGGIVACTNATQDHATFYRARAKLQ
jgi:uncharacterized repeat protein (TIGR03803 family)